MLNKTIGNFVIGIVLLGAGFGLFYSIEPFFFSDFVKSMILVCLTASLVFALLSMFKGVKRVKGRRGSFRYNLIAIIGGFLITIFILYCLAYVLIGYFYQPKIYFSN
jgi:hypothetical protein